MGLMHSCIFNMMDDVELVAVCEINGLVRKFAKKMIPNIAFVENLEELKIMALDALCITTPPSSHFLLIKTSYEKKIAQHIFTEKPLAINNIQAEELISLASRTGGVNMVGYHRRFSVTFCKAKQLLESGAIGYPMSFKGHAYSADFLKAKTAKQAINRGGVIEDSGCHVIDIALWLFGDMEPIHASVKTIIGEDSEDEAYIEVKTAGGLIGELNASWCKEGYRLPDMCLSIIGDKGTLMVNEDNVQLTINGIKNIWYKHDLNDVVPFFIGGSEYQRQDQMFIKAIKEGIKAEPNFYTAAKIHKMVDAVNLMARSQNNENR